MAAAQVARAFPCRLIALSALVVVLLVSLATDQTLKLRKRSHYDSAPLRRTTSVTVNDAASSQLFPEAGLPSLSPVADGAYSSPALAAALPTTIRPCFLLHGLLGYAAGWADFERWAQAMYPNARFIAIPLYEGKASFEPLSTQVDDVAQYIRKIVAADPDTFNDGYYLVGHSQGALILRAVVESMDDHMALSLVSLAGPQMGVYGKASDWIGDVFSMGGEDVSDVFYNPTFQTTLSVADMWNDPLAQGSFIQDNAFLPKLNGLLHDGGNARRKANFVRLKNAVFLGGVFEDDMSDTPNCAGGVEPARSEIFDFYKPGSLTEFVPMKQQRIYVDDTFGLRTLDEQGKLVVKAFPNVIHSAWIHNESVVKQYVLKYLF
eukprot:TRINITY_DN45788_c0_g1_i1.p1 TRINITY_DN45788_c0_g1~~TRINITY_DN45788_c0_g1_i1.p1  ORF type:complete len:377 (-),score=55.50 TRINITY_DN45788_c0_g1_i1:236-1366(-)